jgi:hypothetical protein
MITARETRTLGLKDKLNRMKEDYKAKAPKEAQ